MNMCLRTRGNRGHPGNRPWRRWEQVHLLPLRTGTPPLSRHPVTALHKTPGSRPWSEGWLEMFRGHTRFPKPGNKSQGRRGVQGLLRRGDSTTNQAAASDPPQGPNGPRGPGLN